MNDPGKRTGAFHWSFWIIGGVTLLFNVAGAANFLTQMNPDVVAAMPDEYRAIVESRPAWATVAFAVGVFGGVLGCILLLLRKSVAYYVLIASLLGAVAAQIPLFGMIDMPAGALIGGSLQLVVTGLLIWYVRRAERKGWIS